VRYSHIRNYLYHLSEHNIPLPYLVIPNISPAYFYRQYKLNVKLF